LSESGSRKISSTKPALYYYYTGLTHTGMVRDHNEDAYKLPQDTDASTLARKGHLYVLADGMGGHKKGEVASAITIETVNAAYYTSAIPIPDDDPEQAIVNALAQAIEKANLEVMDATQGGGTTVVAAVLHGDWLVAMNVGDSRAYILRGSELRLLSKDHSLVARLVEMGKISAEEALTHPRRNVLYQALGQGADVEIHISSERLQPNDVIILCSDGLWGEVGDPAIKEVLSTATDPATAAEQLIDRANRSGGPDNITTIIIQVSDKELPDVIYSPASQSPRPKTDPDDDTEPSLIPPRYQKPENLPEADP
jgi:PPM family protein phosphatase